MLNLIIAVSFIVLISLSSWRSKSLTLSGAIGAMFVGIFIYSGFSWQGLVLLGCFFGSSSYVSKYKAKLKTNVMDIIEKGDQRDIVQVIANGGIPASLGLLTLFLPSFEDVFLIGFCVSLAAATSDTWASEIGTLSKKDPRMLFTLKTVPRGTSGAVSSLGTSAGLLGAMFISGVSILLFSLSPNFFLYIIFMGFLGNIFDTILGQTIQIKYCCSACQKITEKQVHCRVKGEKLHRYSFLTNDSVNISSIMLATLLSILFLKI